MRDTGGMTKQQKAEEKVQRLNLPAASAKWLEIETKARRQYHDGSKRVEGK